jgi:hypothetical protein
MSSANSLTSTDRSVSQAESWAVVACCTVISMIAIVWSWRHDAMLNYGDAVAHLHIARRVFDSRTPRFSQLGSVWLPLPHILLLPFVQNYQWWATGLAGVIPSALAYIAACAGLYRLARRFMSRAVAWFALAFFALNPNLLYLQTTAMTEPLFLCEVVWIVVWMVEWRDALNIGAKATRGPANGIFATRSSRLQACIAAALVAAIFTRYDGWIIALIAWTGMGLALWSHRRLASLAFWLLSIAVVAAPILWFTYNSVCFQDWLYFARGPYSAKAIELRTAAHGAGPLHPGWHNPWVSFLFYLKVTELDAIAAPGWRSLYGNLALVLSALGFIAALFAERPSVARRVFSWLFLLWLPVPFYTWSVAYGSVPIFFPAWWPHSVYNTRYGLELLPALAIGLALAAQSTVRALHQVARFLPQILNRFLVAPFLPVTAYVACLVLIAVNLAQLLRAGPLVYLEGTKNLDARLAYEEAIPPVLQDLLSLVPRAPVLMDTSTYPELIALTGIPLRQTINESDLEIFRAALADPASSAAIVVAFQDDDFDRAVKAHPQGLVAVAHFTANTQRPATIYFSTKWLDKSPLLNSPSLDGPLKGLLPPSSARPPENGSRVR